MEKIEEKSKVETRKEFDENAIKWGIRIGVTDTAIAKTLYWCVLNVYAMQQDFAEMKEILDRILEKTKDVKK